MHYSSAYKLVHKKVYDDRTDHNKVRVSKKLDKTGILTSQVQAYDDLLKIKDNAGLVPFIILSYSSLMPCSSFNRATQLMALVIIRLAACYACENRVGQCCDLKVAKEEVFGIEEKD
jgi:hypothetical protein